MTTAALEARVRRAAKRQGYALMKSRRTGLYSVIEPYTNIIVFGRAFDASLEEVEAFFLDEDDAASPELVMEEQPKEAV
jgi:hypothetical protein